MIWITATGEWVRISEMGIPHIRNCIKMIDSGRINDSYRISTYSSLKRELIKRYYDEATKT